jgi:hypothetical protein
MLHHYIQSHHHHENNIEEVDDEGDKCFTLFSLKKRYNKNEKKN